VPAPLRPLNPQLLRRIERSYQPKSRFATVGGWPHYVQLFEILRSRYVKATPLTIARLERVADAVEFPRNEIFLDEGTR
jgi:hypothetical protein